MQGTEVCNSDLHLLQGSEFYHFQYKMDIVQTKTKIVTQVKSWNKFTYFLNLPTRRQEEITAEKEEIDRQKKLLFKKRPSNSEGGGGRGKRAGAAGAATSAVVVGNSVVAAPVTPGAQPLHNGTEPPTFLKPDPLPSMTWQEYYEADEILKVSGDLLYT